MDEEGYRGGWSNRGLVKQGVVQSKKLAAYLVQHAEDYHIQTLLSSNLTRAAETAKEIEQSLQVKAIYSDEWREMNNGILAGMPNKVAEERFPGVYFNTLQMDTPFPGGETPTHFIQESNKHLIICVINLKIKRCSRMYY
nr:histidine phosphatase family protein [Paenibacillus sp. 1001270B_150601_E10]